MQHCTAGRFCEPQSGTSNTIPRTKQGLAALPSPSPVRFSYSRMTNRPVPVQLDRQTHRACLTLSGRCSAFRLLCTRNAPDTDVCVRRSALTDHSAIRLFSELYFTTHIIKCQGTLSLFNTRYKYHAYNTIYFVLDVQNRNMHFSTAFAELFHMKHFRSSATPKYAVQTPFSQRLSQLPRSSVQSQQLPAPRPHLQAAGAASDDGA